MALSILSVTRLSPPFSPGGPPEDNPTRIYFAAATYYRPGFAAPTTFEPGFRAVDNYAPGFRAIEGETDQ